MWKKVWLYFKIDQMTSSILKVSIIIIEIWQIIDFQSTISRKCCKILKTSLTETWRITCESAPKKKFIQIPLKNERRPSVIQVLLYFWQGVFNSISVFNATKNPIPMKLVRSKILTHAHVRAQYVLSAAQFCAQFCAHFRILESWRFIAKQCYSRIR